MKISVYGLGRAFGRQLAVLFLVCLTIFSVNSLMISAPPVQASDWAGWDAINTIYYNPSQDDTNNHFLQQASLELRNQLLKAGKTLTITTASRPGSGSIYLEVNAGLPALAVKNEESFRLLSDANGVYVTGKTPLAVRHGAFSLLKTIGFRWFFKSDIWEVTPESLPSLQGLNEVDGPDFIYRSIIPVGYNGTEDFIAWAKRNSLYGAGIYQVSHSYFAILEWATGITTTPARTAYWTQHPGQFLPDNGPDSPWQLNPTNATVIQWAKEYADEELAGVDGVNWYFDDILPNRVAVVSPNDGDGFGPPYNSNQDITDVVYGLANTVAASISENHPGDMIGLYNYSHYSQVPSQDLEPNILSMVSTAYNYGDLTIAERILGLINKGTQVGIRDYVDIWGWWEDKILAPSDRALDLETYYALGARYYNCEAADNWGGAGLRYYLLSQVLWDGDANLGDVLDDFYSKSFGAAADTMAEFYQVRGSGGAELAESLRLLNQAEDEAAGDDSALARIHFLEAYTYFVWKWHNVGISNLSNAELEDFYTFLTKTRDWYIVTYSPDIAAVTDELEGRGYASGQIAALQDYTTPTTQDVAEWMDQALTAWGGIAGPVSNSVNPFDLDLEALGDMTAPGAPPETNNLNILVPSSGNESVTVRVKGGQGNVMWCTSGGVLLDHYEFTSPLSDWTNISFMAAAPGIYVIHVPYYYNHLQSTGLSIDVQGRPASILAAPGTLILSVEESSYLSDTMGFSGSYTGYFYVPTGTNQLTFGYTPWETKTVSGTLTDPGQNSHPFSCVGGGLKHGYGGDQTVYNSPQPGLWKIQISTTSQPGYFWFEGIPPLVWHDPQYLLVPGDGYTPPPSINHAPVLQYIGAKSVVKEETLQFTVSAGDADGDSITYSVSNLPGGATFDTGSCVFSWTPGVDQVGTYNNIRFSASDGSLADYEYVTIIVQSEPGNPTQSGTGGGGGGGGGGSGGKGITRISDSSTDNGRIVVDVVAEDAEQKVKLVIPEDTIVLTSNRQVVSSISIKPSTEMLSLDPGSVPIGTFYSISPSGTTFSPAATLVFKYSDAMLPAGISEDSLFIALWDTNNNVWTDLSGTVDPELNTVSIEVQHLSTYTMMAHTRPASFELTGIAVDRSEVSPGEPVTLSFEVSNDGDLTGTYQAAIILDDAVVETRTVDLAGQESQILQFTVTSDVAGKHTAFIGDLAVSFDVTKPPAPAEFLTSNLAVSPSAVMTGDKLDVFVLVMNAGGLPGTYGVALKIDDGVVQSRDIELGGGESELVDFNIDAGLAGQHTVEINGLTAVYNVHAPVGGQEITRTTVNINEFQVNPAYSSETGNILSARVSYSLGGSLEQVAGGGLSLKVYRDGVLLEEVPLHWLNQPQSDDVDYTPALGWEAGSYTFLAQLHTIGSETRIAGPAQFTVAPGAVTAVVSWKILGIIIGATLAVTGILVVIVIFRRRDMLSWRY